MSLVNFYSPDCFYHLPPEEVRIVKLDTINKNI